ncbi:hypothetical protein VTI28DRAFT_2636 [Corynascus sepedonium]
MPPIAIGPLPTEPSDRFALVDLYFVAEVASCPGHGENTMKELFYCFPVSAKSMIEPSPTPLRASRSLLSRRVSAPSPLAYTSVGQPLSGASSYQPGGSKPPDAHGAHVYTWIAHAKFCGSDKAERITLVVLPRSGMTSHLVQIRGLSRAFMN